MKAKILADFQICISVPLQNVHVHCYIVIAVLLLALNKFFLKRI